MANEHTSFKNGTPPHHDPRDAAPMVRINSVSRSKMDFVAVPDAGSKTQMNYSGYPASWWLAMALVCVAALVVMV